MTEQYLLAARREQHRIYFTSSSNEEMKLTYFGLAANLEFRMPSGHMVSLNHADSKHFSLDDAREIWDLLVEKYGWYRCDLPSEQLAKRESKQG